MRLTIGKKLNIGFGAVILITLALGLFSFFVIKDLCDLNCETHDRLYLDMRMDEERSEVILWFGGLKELVYYGAPFKGDIDYDRCNFGRFLAGLEDDAKFKGIVETLSEPHRKLHEFAKEIVTLYDGGDKKGALKVFNDKLSPSYSMFMADFKEITDRLMADVGKGKSRLHNEARRSMKVVLAVVAAAIFAAFMVSVVLKRAIAEPVNELLGKTSETAGLAYDLSQQVKIFSDDEVGDLAREINKMGDNFKNSIREIAVAEEKLVSYAHGLAGAAKGLEHASKYISHFTGKDSMKGEAAPDVEKAAHELAVSSAEMAAAAEQISDLSDNLQKIVRKFRIQ